MLRNMLACGATGSADIHLTEPSPVPGAALGLSAPAQASSTRIPWHVMLSITYINYSFWGMDVQLGRGSPLRVRDRSIAAAGD